MGEGTDDSDSEEKDQEEKNEQKDDGEENKEKEPKEGCCAQSNKYASDMAVTECTKQTDCDACGALENFGCEWRKGEDADCSFSKWAEAEEELFGDVDSEVPAESAVSGWYYSNVILLVVATFVVLVIYRCRKAEWSRKYNVKMDGQGEGRPLLQTKV